MLNISKIIPQGKLKIPTLSLIATASVLVLGTIGQMTTINLKSQAIAADIPGYTNRIQSGENSLLSKLRSFRDTKSQFSSDTTNTIETKDSLSETLKRSIQIQTNTKPSIQEPLFTLPKQDGIYLYGQSSVPDQLGQGYIVFQKHKGKVTGALYMPSSEFSCFQGTIARSGELAMTVTSSPSETGIAQVSATSRIPRITDEISPTYAYSVALRDYHQLASVGENDRKILQACQQDLGGNN
ncbi:MAG: hypothetical protein F6K62_00720 [Sphaerospermopsis sp. SIO1G2]|nr:hypothetical protein [Sphaerospermopsis sp. SIO1G2]